MQWGLIFSAVLFFASIGTIAAQTEEVTLEWVGTRGARGYVVEIKSPDRGIIHRSTTIRTYLLVQLKAGEYKVRITEINKFGKMNTPGEWESYVVAPDRSAEKSGEPDPSFDPLESTFDGGGIWRSLLLPGWGQMYQKRNGIALWIGGGFAAGVLSGAILYSDYRRHKAVYGEEARSALILFATSPAAGFAAREKLNANRQALNRRGQNLNTLAGVLGALYLFNLADVTIAEAGRGRITASIGPGADALAVRFVCLL